MYRLFYCLFPLLFLSCVAPADYNDALIREQQKVLSSIKEVNASVKQSDVATTILLIEKAQIQVSKSIQKIQQKDDFRGEIDLRNRMVELLQFYQYVLNEYYPLLVDIQKDAALNVSEKETLTTSIYALIAEQEQEKTKPYAEAQKQFAEKYYISIISYQK